MAEARTIKIAAVQAMDGHTTLCGPHDYDPDHHSSQMDAALSWHLEAGHLPAACYWINASIPPLPSIPELLAAAERGEFPKSFVADMDAYSAGLVGIDPNLVES